MNLFNTPWLQERRPAPLPTYAAPAYGRRYGRRDGAVPTARPEPADAAWPTLRLRGVGRAEAAAIRAYFDRAA